MNLGWRKTWTSNPLCPEPPSHHEWSTWCTGKPTHLNHPTLAWPSLSGICKAKAIPNQAGRAQHHLSLNTRHFSMELEGAPGGELHGSPKRPPHTYRRVEEQRPSAPQRTIWTTGTQNDLGLTDSRATPSSIRIASIGTNQTSGKIAGLMTTKERAVIIHQIITHSTNDIRNHPTMTSLRRIKWDMVTNQLSSGWKQLQR